jgi:hypothetical protein
MLGDLAQAVPVRHRLQDRLDGDPYSYAMSEIPNETTSIKIAIHNANVDTDGFISALAHFITEQPWMTPDARLVMSVEPPTAGDDNQP